MAKKINFGLHQYPLLEGHGQISLKPCDIFRLEGVPFFLSELGHEYFSNVLLMFTGLISKDQGSSFLHCIPIFFYGSNDRHLTDLCKGKNLWVEVVHEVVSLPQPEGYWN